MMSENACKALRVFLREMVPIEILQTMDFSSPQDRPVMLNDALAHLIVLEDMEEKLCELIQDEIIDQQIEPNEIRLRQLNNEIKCIVCAIEKWPKNPSVFILQRNIARINVTKAVILSKLEKLHSLYDDLDKNKLYAVKLWGDKFRSGWYNKAKNLLEKLEITRIKILALQGVLPLN